MSAQAADPAAPDDGEILTLRVTQTPERVVIGDPWPVQAVLRNDTPVPWPAPSEEAPLGIIVRLMQDGAALDAAIDGLRSAAELVRRYAPA